MMHNTRCYCSEFGVGIPYFCMYTPDSIVLGYRSLSLEHVVRSTIARREERQRPLQVSFS